MQTAGKYATRICIRFLNTQYELAVKEGMYIKWKKPRFSVVG